MGGSDDRLTNSVGDSADVACRHFLAKKPEARPKNKSKYIKTISDWSVDCFGEEIFSLFT